MKRKTILLILLLSLLTLSGCQLATQEESGGDQLIGVYLTRKHLDTIDVEACIKDSPDEVADGETIQAENSQAKADQKRIYAVDRSQDAEHPAYAFAGLEGVAVYCVPVPNPDGEGFCWTPGQAPEVWQHNDYTAGEEGDTVVMTADLYVLAQDKSQEFFANPMYRAQDGQVYLVGGTGVSGDLRQAGTSVGQTLAETAAVTINGETSQQSCEVKVTVTSVLPLEKTVLLQMDANSQVIDRMEFLPGQVPDTFAPAAETAYLVVETHRTSASGEACVDRELFDRQDSALSTYAEGENGFFCRTDTSLVWTEAEG